MTARITLLTDFGTRDGYVAAMKGVIASIAPDAAIDDASHDVEPGDVESAAWALATYAFLYPPDSVHVCVVDPGVGSARRALALRAHDRFFVGPDNGVFTRVLERAPAAVHALTSERYFRDPVSRTFHGRDVFAPVAAHLARGVALDLLGPPVTDPVRLESATPVDSEDRLEGAVVHVDRFGNLITNLPAGWCTAVQAVTVGSSGRIPFHGTYADVADGEAVALIGSAGLLEIGVRNGSAAAHLEVGRGARVTALREA